VGKWGLRELVEPRLRQLVADRLGVGREELTPGVVLADDLAADSLDVLEVALAAEDEFGIVIAERALATVRTYGDLVETVSTLLARQCAGRPEAWGPVWARVLRADHESSAGPERSDFLTPYLAETIAEDALRAGQGAWLEVTLPEATTDAGLATVQERFAWLGNRGVQVSVRRHRPRDAPPEETDRLAERSHEAHA
jgi:acyl carrier protein